MSKAASRKHAVYALPVLVLVVTVGLLLVHYQQVTQLKQKAFESLVLETQQQAKTQLKRHLDPVPINLAIVGRWVEAESPNLRGATVINSRLMPILQEVPQISSALIADSDGREYMLLRTEEGWLTRLNDMQRQGDRSQWNRWTGPSQPVEAWNETIDYCR